MPGPRVKGFGFRDGNLDLRVSGFRGYLKFRKDCCEVELLRYSGIGY